MTHFLFVTPERDNLAALAVFIEDQGVKIDWAASGGQALKTIGQHPVDLVVTDESVGDMSGLEFIERLVKVNPMINCAVVSALSDEAYHEASEGLGILMKLPPNPGEEDGQRLLAHLDQILGLGQNV